MNQIVSTRSSSQHQSPRADGKGHVVSGAGIEPTSLSSQYVNIIPIEHLTVLQSISLLYKTYVIKGQFLSYHGYMVWEVKGLLS